MFFRDPGIALSRPRSARLARLSCNHQVDFSLIFDVLNRHTGISAKRASSGLIAGSCNQALKYFDPYTNFDSGNSLNKQSFII